MNNNPKINKVKSSLIDLLEFKLNGRVVLLTKLELKVKNLKKGIIKLNKILDETIVNKNNFDIAMSTKQGSNYLSKIIHALK